MRVRAVSHCEFGALFGVGAVVAGFFVVLPVGLADEAAPPRTMLMCLIFIGRNGLSLLGSLAIRAICLTRARLASSHWPKMVCLPFKCGVGTSVMKNCDPFVLGPEFAMASRPGRSNMSEATISSLNL